MFQGMTVRKRFIGFLFTFGMFCLAWADDAGMLIWTDDLPYLNVGEKSSYLSASSSPVKEENGEKFITVKNARDVMRSLPRGDVFGDYELSFMFRPKSEKWQIETVHHGITGGSRRYRLDTLARILMKMSPSQITVDASYMDKPFDSFKHMTIAPRTIGAGLPAFPKIEKKVYSFDTTKYGKTNEWLSVSILVDRHDYKISFNGEVVAHHKINPACGSIGLQMFGECDVKKVKCRALRPLIDPFSDENMMTR